MENPTSIKYEISISPSGNPIIDTEMNCIEAVYAHKIMIESSPKLVLYQGDGKTIIKPVRGLVVKIAGTEGLWRMTRLRRVYDGERYDTARAATEAFDVDYFMQLAPSLVDITKLQRLA